MNQIRGCQLFKVMRNRSLRDRKLSHQRFAWNLVMAGDCRQDGEPLGVRDRLGDSLLLTFGQPDLCGCHSSNLGILGIACQHRCQKKGGRQLAPDLIGRYLNAVVRLIRRRAVMRCFDRVISGPLAERRHPDLSGLTCLA
ncbi:MAG: hypothetical protein P1U77_04450 [Rubripirellula sp.]|nr:hypothetical protein [Rubripirellula sp.]